MKKLLLIALASVTLWSCAKPHEAWTGHKEKKPRAGRNNANSYIQK